MLCASSALRGRSLAARCLFATCLFVAGCGARSTLEGGESAGQGGSTGTTTASETTSTPSTTSTTPSTTSTSTTTTTPTFNVAGCADGEREGFLDKDLYPLIAGCSGGFQVPGVLEELTAPTCGQTAGDDSANPDGNGCNAWDLCAPGWHVCGSAVEVATLAVNGCADAAPPGAPVFFVTRQSGTGCGVCAMGGPDEPACSFCSCEFGCPQTTETSNDLFGCGNTGLSPNDCGVLNAFSDDSCGALGFPWKCDGDSCGEAHQVRKLGPDVGGVLCCMDMLD